MPTHDSNKPMTVLGVPGRLTHRITTPHQATGLWFMQRWISEARPIKYHGAKCFLQVAILYDDELGNRHNSFSITADVKSPDRGLRDRIVACGCLHDDIARVFPELAPLIKWHLTGSDGPTHYIANTVVLAGDRDHWGLRTGEQKPLLGPDGVPHWELVAVMGLGVALSGTPTGLKHTGSETVPLSVLRNSHKGETPPATPRLEWRRTMVAGKGKGRDLDAARKAAVWPDATDAQLCAEPAELRAMLIARLPALMVDFRAAITGAGFLWSPEDVPAAA